MLVTMVRAVPFWDGGALRATRVEKSGESEITTIPQKRRNAKNQDAFSQVNAQGSTRPVSYTHLTLPTNVSMCRSRWSGCD